jgi:hypothetical protein
MNWKAIERANWVIGILGVFFAIWVYKVDHPSANKKKQTDETTPAAKSYQNGYFSFSYPPGWTVEEQGRVVLVKGDSKTAGRQITLNFAPQPPNQTVEALLGVYEDRCRKIADATGGEVRFLHEDTSIGTHSGPSTIGLYKTAGQVQTVTRMTVMGIGRCGSVSGGFDASPADNQAESVFRKIMAEVVESAKSRCDSTP